MLFKYEQLLLENLQKKLSENNSELTISELKLVISTIVRLSSVINSIQDILQAEEDDSIELDEPDQLDESEKNMLKILKEMENGKKIISSNNGSRKKGKR